MNEKVEIIDICKVISAYAVRRGIGLRKLVAEFPALGSVSTFSDMKAGKTDKYDLPAQIANYRAVAQYVAEGAGHEERYPLQAVAVIEGAVKKVMRSWGLDRVVVVDGESGMGKTTAVEMLCAKYGSRLMLLETTEVWDDNPRALLWVILKAFGVLTPPASKVDALDRVLEHLSVSRKCLVIDEAHHLGPRCMNVVKTLVNQSPGEFCLLGIPSVWAKMFKQAYIEARQLFTNRLSERVTLVLDDGAVGEYVKFVFADAAAAEVKKAAQLIRPAAMQHGNMAFVRDVCREMEELTQDAVIAAVQRVAAQKGGR